MKQNKILFFDYGGTLDSGGKHWANVLWEGYQQTSLPLSETLFREAYIFAERELEKKAIIQKEDTFHALLYKKIELQLSFLQRKIENLQDKQTFYKALSIVQEYGYLYAKNNIAISQEVLTQLSSKYVLVLVSNFYGNLNAVLADFNCNVFSTIVESAVIQERKPNQAFFTKALQIAQTKAENVVMIGDSLKNDIVPAKSLGMQTFWLQGEGWDKETSQPKAVFADHLITHLSELLPFFL